jgi:hypothetical protein
MALTPLPPDEEERLVDLYQLHLLDTPPEERFDFLTGLLKELFHIKGTKMILPIERQYTI